MRNALLIAGREYAENARTKGFWINMILFPLLLVAFVKVPQLLEEKAAPTRPFILIDQSGEFEPIVARELERAYQRRVSAALVEWAKAQSPLTKKAERPTLSADDLEGLPASVLEGLMGGGGEAGDLFAQLLEADSAILDAMAEESVRDSFEGLLRTQMEIPEDAPDFVPPRRLLVRVEPPVPLPPETARTMPTEEVVRTLRPLLTGEASLPDQERDLFALVVIPPDAAAALDRPGLQGIMDAAQAGDSPFDGVQYWSVNLTDTELPDLVRRALDGEVREREFVRRGVDSEEVREVQGTRMRFQSFDPTKAEGEEAVSVADTIRKWAPVGFVYLLWNAIFQVVVMLLNNTVEEKSNRIIEVLLSSATPWEIMCGKLIGIAGVGMTMMGAWILSMLGVLKFLAGPEVSWAGPVFEVIRDSGLLPLFALYFFCGYLIYAGLFLAIGSLCSTVKEAQNFMGTAMVVMLVPLMTMVFIARDPHGALATFLTWVPLYTPFTMMNRAAADPPLFDMVGSIVLMLVTMVFMMWMSAKVFRIGVLRTGQPPRLLELFRQLTTSERER